MGEAPSRSASPWLVGPVVDVVVGCGLIGVPAAIAAPLVPEAFTWWIAVVGAALLLVVGHAHLAATLVLGWRLDRRARVVIGIASVLALVIVVAAHRWPARLTWLWTAWVTLAPWHVAILNVRISEVLIRRAVGERANAVDRRPLRLAHLAAALAATGAIHTGPSDTLVSRVGLSPTTGLAFVCVGGVSVMALGFVFLLRIRRIGAGPSVLVATAALAMASVVWLGVATLLGSGIGPHIGVDLGSGVALLVLSSAAALVHGAQSLWLAWSLEGRLAALEARRFDGLAYFGLIFALGIVVVTAGPWVVSRGLGYDLVVSALIVQAAAHLHHVVVDAVVWGLHGPRLASVLDGHDVAPPRRHEISNARALLATMLVGGCVIVGMIDVAQLAGTRPDASEQAAAWARVLNPNDARVWVRSAQRAAADNDVDQARADLGRAVALSPTNVDAQRALLRLHAVTGHLEEAWARWDAVDPGVLDDPENLIVLADVALQLVRFDDAARLGEQAVSELEDALETPAGIDARRVLGMARLELGQTGEAIRLLRGAFNDGEKLYGSDALGEGTLLILGDALARAHVALREWDPASVLWERVLAGATAVDRPDVAVRALLGQAGIALQRDQAREALDRFQRGLKVAEATTSRAVAEQVARAWLDYGGLLAASDAPLRLRLACGIKARQAAERMTAGPRQRELLRFIDEASGFAEEALAQDERAQVRRDPKAAADEALTLSYPEPTTQE
jgi:tetratricopeptide (TPR) repeat protein